jgi:integrase
MGSRYQQGHIEKLGAWIYVRFRVDTEEGRKLVAERICPAGGKGLLSAAQQRRRAGEIIMAASVNNEQKLLEASLGTTFSQQAEWFLKHAQQRKRKPVAPSTIETWQSCIDKWLTPRIGRLPLAQINHAVAKTLVQDMSDAGLSDKSIHNNFGLVKLVIGSATNEDGDQLFPRKWNHEKIDVPVVEPTEQHKPTVSAEQINLMLEKTDDKQLRMLIILAAASGLRLGEILGLSLGNVSADGTLLTITEKAFRSEVQDFLKTKNGKREVDLTAEVGQLLRKYIGDRKTGLVFTTKKGKPLSQSNILRRQLHPLQAANGIEECGFHAFRRYRITHLRMNSTPEGLVQFWAGHSGKSITDGYDKVREDLKFRKEVTKSVGIGFTIPALVVQSVQENEKGQHAIHVGLSS